MYSIACIVGVLVAIIGGIYGIVMLVKGKGNKKKHIGIICISVISIVASVILYMTSMWATIVFVLYLFWPIIVGIGAIIVGIVVSIKKLGKEKPKLAQKIRLGILLTILILISSLSIKIHGVRVIGTVTGVDLDEMVIGDRTYRLVGGTDRYTVRDRGKCIGRVKYTNDGVTEMRVFEFKGDPERRYLYRNCPCNAFFGLCTRDGDYYELVE